jgi:DNA-binding transcriptional LysR family regulator
MDSADLRYLAVTSTAGTFAEAARELGVDSSTVCRRMGRLEDELGLLLFERRRSGLRLTAGGSAVLGHARRALAAIDGMKTSALQNGSALVGEIRIGVRVAPISDAIIALLSEWRASHPRILLKLSELNDRDLASALEDRRIDVALVPSFALWPRVASAPIYREHLVVAIPEQHHLATAPTIAWSSLSEETILVQGWDESQAHREFLASFLGSGVRFHAHAASKQAIFALVAAGYGVALAPQSQSGTNFPHVVFKRIDEDNASFRVDLVWMPEAEEPALGRFVAFMRDQARSRRLF